MYAFNIRPSGYHTLNFITIDLQHCTRYLRLRESHFWYTLQSAGTIPDCLHGPWNYCPNFLCSSIFFFRSFFFNFLSGSIAGLNDQTDCWSAFERTLGLTHRIIMFALLVNNVLTMSLRRPSTRLRRQQPRGRRRCAQQGFVKKNGTAT